MAAKSSQPGRPGAHRAAKSSQPGQQRQPDRAKRSQIEPARAPGEARASQSRPDRASKGAQVALWAPRLRRLGAQLRRASPRTAARRAKSKQPRRHRRNTAPVQRNRRFAAQGHAFRAAKSSQQGAQERTGWPNRASRGAQERAGQQIEPVEAPSASDPLRAGARSFAQIPSS